MSSVAYGVDPSPDDPYAAVLEELTPSKSLGRVASTARFTVGTVSVVGAAITGLGIAASSQLAAYRVTQILAIAAVVLSLLAVTMALAYLTVRVDQLSVGNLVAVEHYLKAQFRRAWLVVLASRLIVLAVLLAGSAAVTALLLANDVRSQVQLEVGSGRNAWNLTGKSVVSGLDPEDRVALTISAKQTHGVMVLYRGRGIPDHSGLSQMEARLEVPSEASGYLLELSVNGAMRRALELPASG